MATYYLKADSEQALWEALESADIAVKLLDPEDENNFPPEGHNPQEAWEPSGAYSWSAKGVLLDMIGLIEVPTGETLKDDDGNEFPEMTAIEGYHANLKASLTSAQEALLPILQSPPKTPQRKWSGDE